MATFDQSHRDTAAPATFKMEMEAYLRRLEGSRRIRRGTTDGLIGRVLG